MFANLDARRALLLASPPFCIGAVAAPDAPAEPSLQVVLRPETDAGGAVTAIIVEERITMGAGTRPLSFSAPLRFAGLVPLASQVTDLRASDADGKIGIKVSDITLDGAAGRRWSSNRSVRGVVTVRYSMPLQPAGASGPPYGVKAAGQGLGGNTASLLIVPDGLDTRATTLGWDLSRMAPGSLGVATGGTGTITVAGSPEKLLDRWILAGPLKGGQRAEGKGFNAYSAGTPPFNAVAMMRWSRTAYAALARRFGYLGAPRYHLFFRTLDGPSYATGTAANAGGGSLITLGTSYVRGQSEADVRNTIVHEMGHQWVGQFDGGGSLWFAEGLNVYVTSTLPCEEGLMAWTDCAEQISKWAKSYYASEGRTWTQEAIEASPFEREDLRLVSYGRGMVYFANLDAQIRAASKGSRNLLSALRPLFEARRDGQPITPERWEAWLRKTRGADAVTTFRNTVLGGELIVPDRNAFAPYLQVSRVQWEARGVRTDGFSWQAR